MINYQPSIYQFIFLDLWVASSKKKKFQTINTKLWEDEWDEMVDGRW